LDGSFQCLTWLDNPVGQADVLGLNPVNTPTGEDQIHGAGMTNKAGKADGAKVDQGHTKASTEHSKSCIGRDHPKVAPKGELKTTGYGWPLDCSNDGFG
jgi:hypothetical protein